MDERGGGRGWRDAAAVLAPVDAAMADVGGRETGGWLPRPIGPMMEDGGSLWWELVVPVLAASAASAASVVSAVSAVSAGLHSCSAGLLTASCLAERRVSSARIQSLGVGEDAER